MKPFDLERALAGDLIRIAPGYGSSEWQPCHFIGVSLDGHPVVEPKSRLGYPVVVTNRDHLCMAPLKRTVYVTLHRQRNGILHAFAFYDASEASTRAGNSSNCLGTFPIEIED
ncbi:hypothetical protein [Paraburkholderia gardini]|uniref:hypothetical protein n=1 Tax=Paraburkholderia gardini TaxID=2823469 RepID=UPI001D920CCB|nr:hypothetical protein [Paraburkholderia gardini]CAG4889515.1 hypothetical protein R69919_00762 [Paraburkholderia gardini]